MIGQSSGRPDAGPAIDPRGSGMDRELSWSVIEAERLRLAALLESLDAQDWDAPSLCSGWRVRDVAAHVALAPQPPSIAGMLVEGARARGRFHILNHDLAVRLANRPGVDLVAELRDYGGHGGCRG
jgi:uncharacterized protein (TIGR03083 family)